MVMVGALVDANKIHAPDTMAIAIRVQYAITKMALPRVPAQQLWLAMDLEKMDA